MSGVPVRGREAELRKEARRVARPALQVDADAVIRPFSAVAVLLRRAWGAGLRIVTASSAKKDELKKIYRRSGYRRPGGCGDVVRGRR